MMEFSPEIAVFHSAFQLVLKQAGKHLSSLSKDSSRPYMEIIKTAVDEICRGLEQDLSEEESAAWNQKLHLICLYSVIENNYREPVEKKPGKVPVCSTLDMVAGMLPEYSKPFYFEMVNTCSWTHLLVECLDYIDKTTATSLLSDLLEHSQHDPVVPYDTKVIAMVTDKILASCLHLPVAMDTAVSTLLKPVTTERRYVQIMYPDDVEGDVRKDVKMNARNDKNENTSNEEGNIDAPFWNHFVDKHPDVILNVLDYFEKCLQSEMKGEKETIDSNDAILTDNLATIFLFWFTHITRSQVVLNTDDWFINNVFVSKYSSTHATNEISNKETTSLRYSLNKSLVDKIGNVDLKQRFVKLVKQSFKQANKCYESIKQKGVVTNDICVLKTKEESVFVKSAVLFRMVQKTVSDMTGGGDIHDLTDMREESVCSSVILEEDWSRDITLDALLWRIENRLYLHEECLQTILSQRCWCLWKYDRLFEVIKASPSILSHQSNFLKLIEILTYLLKQLSCTTVQSMRELLCVVFNALSMMDKDAIVGQLYGDEAVDMGWLLGVEEVQLVHLQITNIFNKVTADMDAQVLEDVFLLCLVDPVTVFRSALEMCVKNQDQALNFAKLLCNMPLTCQTRHEVHHPTRSLLVSTIEGFIGETKFTDKEEKHFILFVRTLMKTQSKEQPMAVLSSTELVNSHLLDAINIQNFSTSDYPIKCSFALSLLLASFECGTNASCDWSECEFEPVVLMVNLAGILHECTELWGDEYEDNGTESSEHSMPSDASTIGDAATSTEDLKKFPVTMVTGFHKIAIKEKVLACLQLVQDMLCEGFLGITDNKSIYWLLAETEDLNCIVKIALANMLFKLGHVQPMTGWMLAFHELTTDLRDNLPSVLLLAITDSRFIEEIDQMDSLSDIPYEDLITALVQIVPNLLIDELQAAIKMIEMFLSKGLLSVYYRSTSHSSLPLIDLSSVRPILCISQIFRDVILTLNVLQGERLAALKHVLQCSVTVMKMKCGQDFKTEELCLFTFSQIFHHICVLVENLPQDCVDNGLVLLLHLLTKFKDISMETTLSNAKVKSLSRDKSREDVKDCGKFNAKLVKNFENAMLLSVERLSDCFEEKHMLIKKLTGPA